MGVMSGRSGWDIGRKARELLMAARQTGRGAAIASRPAYGTVNGTAGAPVAEEVPAGAAIAEEALASVSAAHGTAASAAHGTAASASTAHEAPRAAREAPRAADVAAGADVPDHASGATVPRWLQTAGGWAWRLLFIAIAAYLAYRVAARLAVVVVPCAGALLLTALLQPLTSRLHRAGLPMLAAAWCALLSAVIVLAGVITLVTIRVRAEYPGLVTQIRHTTHEIQTWMAGAPLHLKTGSLQNLSDKLLKYLGQHKSVVAGTVLTGGQIVFEILGGIVLMLFVTFFLLKDGERIWTWLLHASQPGNRPRADRAGRAAWQAVVYYVRGTVLVAAIHAVVIGSTLTIMSVPLVAALAVLVFVAAFVPLVGILFAGAVIILITLATKGWIAAVVVLGIFVAEDQLESHLLQPLVVGRIVRLHPLAIILALGVGGVVAGIPGAVVAVPVAAAITRATPELRRRQPVPDPGAKEGGGDSDPL
jgi:predicted PurR-regulated permease PerM